MARGDRQGKLVAIGTVILTLLSYVVWMTWMAAGVYSKVDEHGVDIDNLQTRVAIVDTLSSKIMVIDNSLLNIQEQLKYLRSDVKDLSKQILKSKNIAEKTDTGYETDGIFLARKNNE